MINVMTRFSFRDRLHARQVGALLFGGLVLLASAAQPVATDAAQSWQIPYGREFWQTSSASPPTLLSAGHSAKEPPLQPDLGAAIERVQHALRPAEENGAWRITARAFHARLTANQIEFRPAAALDEAPLVVRTLGIRRARTPTIPAATSTANWIVTGNTAQRLLDSTQGVVEHVATGAAGVEVTWVLHAPLAGEGDLLIDWQITGRGDARVAEQGWRFAGSQREAAIQIGHAVAVDSAGKRLRLETVAKPGGLAIRVPESLLETAQYPLAIDPLISAEFELSAPVTTPAPSAQFAPAIASDGTNYLVVWHDNRNGPKLDLYAARVGTNGVVLDPSGFALTTATNDQWYPAASFNGTNYLVAWQDARGGAHDIYAARVTPGGTVIETNGLAVVTSANDQRLPAVASLNGDFLIAWQDGRNGTANQDIYAARIRGSGLLVETNGFLISNANNSQSAPAVGVVGTNYVAAWHDFRSGFSLDVYAARITKAGAVLDANAFVVSTAANDQWNVAITGQGVTGLIAWQDGRNGVDADIFAARINESGGVLDPGGLAVSQQPNEQRFPTTGTVGTDFFVAWQDSRAAGAFDLYGTRVTSAGTVVSTAGTLLSDAANDQRFPALATAGDQALVVWEDIRNGVHTDIFGRRLDLNGLPLDASQLVVSTVANAQETPAVAGNGSVYLAVWRDFRTDPLGDIYGTRVATDGTVLDPLGLVLCNAGNYQLAPQVAASGSDFLVVWQDFRNDAHDDILGTRVTGAGTVLDPNGLLISTALGAQRLPAVAGTAAGYLAVWQDRRGGSSDDIFGTRISTDGSIRDAAGLPLCVTLGDQKAPAAAGLNDRYFVAWEDLRGGSSNRVFGTSVLVGGQVATANGFELSSVTGEQLAPRIAASTNQFLAVWQGATNGNGFNIYGTRLTAAGVVLETNSITINAGLADQTRPAVASKGGDFMVVWEDLRITGRTNLYATRITGNGAVLEPAGELTAPDTGRHRAPAIAEGDGDYLLVYQTLDAGNVSRVRGVIQYPAAAPTISLSPGSAQFVAGGGAVAIDTEALLIDGESASFEGGTLTVDIIANASSEDRIGIRHQGSGAGLIGVSGNTVSFGGALIGFFTGGNSGTSPLLVIFNSAATAESVGALARNLTFNNLAAQPFTQPRTVRLTLNLPAGAGEPTSRVVDVIDAGSIPSIVTQPAAQTVGAGGSVTLSVVASGSQPITYQWQLNGVNIPGATSASYKISELQAATAGAYTVVVANQYDYVISAVAAVAYFDIELYAGLTLAGPVGTNYRVEWRPAVGDPSTWQTLTNVTLGSGSMLFFDPDSSRRNQRFYRAIREE